MVYPIEKILKIVASFFRFLRSSPKNAENSIFLICALKSLQKGDLRLTYCLKLPNLLWRYVSESLF